MKMQKITYLFILLYIIIPKGVNASEPIFAKTVEAVRINEKINIDGILSENAWKRPGFTQLLQQEPNQGNQPTQKTEIWIAYDDAALYFACKLYDNHPDSILAL